jgi:hypothetical protein
MYFIIPPKNSFDSSGGGNRVGEARGEPYRPDHALVVGYSAPRYVESRAVIDRGPYYRQPEGHIDRFAERDAFYRNQALIVIAGRDRVELSARGPYENGIARKRTAHIDVVPAATLFDGRFYLAGFFASEETVFGSMRVEPGHGYARPGYPEPFQLPVGEPNRLQNEIACNRFYCVGQAHMNCHKEYAQVAGKKAHQRFLRAAKRSQHLRVTGKRGACHA